MQKIFLCTKDPFMYWFRRSCHNVKNCNFFINRCLQIQSLYQEKHTHHKGPIFHSWRQKPFEKTLMSHKVQELLTSAILSLEFNKPVKCFSNQTLVGPAGSGLLPTTHSSCTAWELCRPERLVRGTSSLFSSGCSIPLVTHKLFKSPGHTGFSVEVCPQEFGLFVKLIRATEHFV